MSHTVLLVDDDANLLLGLRRALREQPYRLHTARSGEDAQFILNTHKIDVIVADEKMPGMSGCEILAWVAKNYPDVVRIMLTGYANSEMAIRAINEASVYQFFTKPCNDADLAIAIRKALEDKDRLEQQAGLVESNRQQSRRLERFHRDVEMLARVVIQDLKKPLEVIAQACRLLAEKYQDAFDPKTSSVVYDAMDAVGEVQRLVHSLLDDPRAKSLSQNDHSHAGRPGDARSSVPAQDLPVAHKDY